MFSGDEVRKQAGMEAHRPLTRSYIKPRLLFQEEIKKNRQMREEDEEAVTDIEEPIATPSRKGRKYTDLASPTKQQEATPPPTIPAKRRKMISPSPTPNNVDPSSDLSFETWGRVKAVKKSDEEPSRGKKRAHEESAGTSHKRVKSEQSSTQSTDSF